MGYVWLFRIFETPGFRRSRNGRGGSGRPGIAFPASDLGCDGLERGAEVRADQRHRADDHNRYQAGNQAVFDGRDAGFITDETRKPFEH
jgi:hypothetical protein